MDTSQQVAVVPKDREALVAPQRRQRSSAEKRRIVEETLVEGASVARVARARHQRQPGVWMAQALPGRKPRGAQADHEVAASSGERKIACSSAGGA
jgi:transposase-like protein